MITSDPIENFFNKDKREIEATLQVNTVVRGAIKNFLDERKFVEINPVIISPISDPLNHPVDDPVIDYYGNQYRLTKSMIFHKQLSMVYFDRIYSFSPNVRLEPLERRKTGRHLAEFTQLDLEVRDAKRETVMDLAEDLINRVIAEVKSRFSPDFLNPGLMIYNEPFVRIGYSEAREKYGDEFETVLSEKFTEPFWIIDIPLEAREFYDKETRPGSGLLSDMDLIYPFGFGEAISGGEREHEYDRIMERIKKKGQNARDYSLLLDASRRGLPPSAGFGIGIERFVRFLRGLRNITDATLFPKIIGDLVL